jgi:hypothetical protein
MKKMSMLLQKHIDVQQKENNMPKTDTPPQPANNDDGMMSMETARAKMALRPTVNAAWTMTNYSPMFDKLDLGALIDELSNSTVEVIEGKMDKCEAMLLNQAYALQSIFTGLSQKAVEQSQLRHYSTLLKLAFKAQSQCRTTLEALANLKKPPAIFANQANIAQGHQQINNTVQLPAQADGTEKIKYAQNELLGTQDEQRLELRTQSQTSSSHSSLETVGEVHRPEIVRRQAKSLL